MNVILGRFGLLLLWKTSDVVVLFYGPFDIWAASSHLLCSGLDTYTSFLLHELFYQSITIIDCMFQ